MATKIGKLERLTCALGAWTQYEQIFLSVNMLVPIKDNLKIFTENSVQRKAIPPKIVPYNYVAII